MKLHLGIIAEGKTPPDTRVPLSPQQCRKILATGRFAITVEPSPHRCFADAEYRQAGINLSANLNACDVLIGVKEVPIDNLIDGKTYLFFSHTIKQQSYNRDLLQAILQKNITLVDWECLTNNEGIRVIAFGRWAGIVGAHNGLMAYGKRTGAFDMPPVHSFHDFEALKAFYSSFSVAPLKTVVTGGGRVAAGSIEVLEALQIKRITPEELLYQQIDKPVYVQLDVDRLYARKSDHGFDMQEFFADPGLYKSIFEPYTHHTDLLINAIYWNPAAPRHFSVDDMQQPSFSIRTIADISCDIGGSVPATLRATTIDEPVFGFDPETGRETNPYLAAGVDIMAVDNLPNELPRDASEDFGNMFIDHVLDNLSRPDAPMIRQATIAANGQLTGPFSYLQDFVDGISH